MRYDDEEQVGESLSMLLELIDQRQHDL